MSDKRNMIASSLVTAFGLVAANNAHAFEVNSYIYNEAPFYEVRCERGDKQLSPRFYVTYGYDSHDSMYTSFEREEFDALFGDMITFTGEEIPAPYNENFKEAHITTPDTTFPLAIRHYEEEYRDHRIYVIMNESDFESLLLQTQDHGLSNDGWVCERRDFTYER